MKPLSVIAFVFVVLSAMCFWTDSNLDFWVSHFKGREVNVPMWLSVLVTFLGNGFVLLGNIIAEIAKFAV